MASRTTLVFIANDEWNIINYRLSLINELLEQGFKIEVLIPNSEALKKLKISKLVIVKEFPFLSGKHGDFRLTDLIALIKDIRRNTESKGILAVGLVAITMSSLFIRIPKVHLWTGLGSVLNSKQFKWRLFKWILPVIISRDSLAITQNQFDKTCVHRMFNYHDVVVVAGSGYNGNYTWIQNESINSVHSFLYAGRILGDKGVRELLDTFKRINRNGIKHRLFLAGSFESDNPTVLRFSEKEVLDYKAYGIEFLGFRKDVKSLIERSDCLIHPSYHEGLPRIVIEAFAVGLPVLLSNIPAHQAFKTQLNMDLFFNVKSADSIYHSVVKFTELSIKEKRAISLANRKLFESTLCNDVVISKYVGYIKKMMTN